MPPRGGDYHCAVVTAHWRRSLLLAPALAAAWSAPAPIAATASPPQAQEAALRIFLSGGPKTHGPGAHDAPRFVDEWTALLRARGAQVEGALRLPSAAEYGRTDVLVLYKADGGSIHGQDRVDLERFLARGGGIVVLHDALCGDDPQWWKTIIGGAWDYGRAKYEEGATHLYLTPVEHPITRGVSNFEFEDEIYYDLEMMPGVQVLASGFHSIFAITPQMWTYEPGPYRAFVSVQGHEWRSFAHPAWRTLVLRGIAWAGGRDADLLTAAGERAQLRYPPGGPTAPDEAHESFVLHPDFEIALVAAEPLIEKPISLDWDAAGRMWVAETPGYPEKERFSGVAAHDRVSILADTDGNGRMDRKQVFCDGLDLVTSIVLHRDGVIASASPDIWWLRDTDGDGACDRRERLYSGFGYGDTHAVVSNLRWGQDGWIYATQGYSGSASRDIAGAQDQRFGAIGNGVIRFRPDGGAIEVVSSYGSNTWGLDFSADGELFFTMANGAHLRHVVLPEAALARGRMDVKSWADVPDHERAFPLVTRTRPPYAQIDFVGGFTAASGCCIYTGGAWPDEYDGNHFVCEPTLNLVHRDLLSPDGVTYAASKEREAEFLASPDLWFRPVHLRVGPDGALYVLDFYNQAVVHNDPRGPEHGPTNAARRPDRDHENGRIWRVQHRRARALERMDLARADAAVLYGALSHPNGWARATAQRLIVEQDVAAPEGWRPPDPVAEALYRWVVFQQDGLALPAPSTGAPAVVQRAAARIARQVEDPNAATALLASWRDADARTRLEILAAQRAWPRERDLASSFLKCYGSAQEDWTRSVVFGLAATDPVAFFAGLPDVQALDGCANLVLAVGRRAGQLTDTSAVADCLSALADRVTSTRIPPEEVELVELAVSGIADTAQSSRWNSGDATLLDALQRLLSTEAGWAVLPVAARLQHPPLAGAIAQATHRVAAELEREDLDWRRRVAALDTLLALPDPPEEVFEAAAALLGPAQWPDCRRQVLGILGEAPDDAPALFGLVDVVAGAFSSLPETERELGFQHLLQRPQWSRRFLEGVRAQRPPAAVLGPARAYRLLHHPDPGVAELAQQVLAPPESDRSIEDLVAQLLPVITQPGDLQRGRALFMTNCGTCHRLRGEGGEVGPDLTGMGAHELRDLLPIVLDPNRAVEAAYLEYVAETTGGRLISGVLVRDTTDGIVLRSSGGDQEIARAQLRSLSSTGRSPMPTGFESLGAEGLRDLFAYLRSGYERFRVLDLAPLCSASTALGLYDTRYDAKPMDFVRYGTLEVAGVPFELLDPARNPGGRNALVLRGGLHKQWQCNTDMPQRVEIPVGAALERVHVLGGIAGWGFPYVSDTIPALRWTWVYAGGATEEHILRNGVEFADWIRHVDVPGSEFAPGLLKARSWGQVRQFHVQPERPEVVDRIILESFGNDLAPTVLALTAELAES